MRTRLLVIVIGGSFVVLAAWSLQFGATPALAQTTCQTGQTYCPSGAYAGQCRPNTVTCPTGSVSATVGGCSTCSCPGGRVVCSGACQVPKSCPDPNRSTSDQCAVTNAASCGACASGYTLDAGTNTCVLQSPVILAPLNPQERSSNRSAINVIQGGTGLLFNLQAQNGEDGATRRQIISVDKSGLMIGYDPDAAKIGIDLSAAGGQNIIYGIARAVGLDAALDSLLKLQVREADGTINNRFRIDGSGNVVAAGSVRGSQLCIGADCKNSWNAVAPAGVLLQNTTPGTQQAGHFNVSGTGWVGSLIVSGSGAFGSLDVASGIQAGSGNVNIVDATGKIPALSSTYLANLSGANLTSLNASNLASGTVPDARLPVNLMRTTYDAGASNPGPWVTLQGGATVLGNIALRLFDGGTADGNVNILEFAYSGGSGPMLGAKIRSTSVGTNMASGAKLTLETTSNNAGTLNANQLVLDRDGNIGIGVADPGVRLQVAGGLTTSGDIVDNGTLTVSDDITSAGDITATGNLEAKNTYECVNVGSELRCNLRQYWRTADKTSGYVESWIGSDTCTNICSHAGLRACTDIQFNFECPNGTLLQTWQDDDPGEFNPSERTCSSSEPYRAVVSGVTCAGQTGTEYMRFRCRCQS